MKVDGITNCWFVLISIISHSELKIEKKKKQKEKE
jgi:hypothetical protein